MSIYKYYNEFELRFLHVLVDKKVWEKITHLQHVQPVRRRKKINSFHVGDLIVSDFRLDVDDIDDYS